MEKKLPKGWVEVELDKVLFYKKGKKPKVLEDEPFIGSVPYLDIKAFEKDEIQRHGDIESSNIIDENSVGIVWDGARSGWVGTGKYGAVGSTIAILKPILIESQYLFRFLQSKFDYINSNTRGTGIPHVDPAILWSIRFPLPPLPEQKRMVAKLDVLFAQLEQLKSRLNKVPWLLKDFRQSVLSQAVTGKLTEEWREGKELESKAFEIRKSFSDIDNLGTDRKKFMKAESPIIEKQDKNWIRTQFYNLCVLKRGYDLPVPKRNLDGEFVVASSAGIISKHDQYKIDEGIVVGRSGSVGCVHYIGKKHWPLNTTLFVQDFCGNNIKWVYFFLLNYNFLKYSSSTAVPTLNRNSFVNEMVLIPPFEEQAEIVKRVEALFAKADQIEASYEKLKTQVENLPQAILAKAFKGELVEQLPGDGDARELLKEIEGMKKESVKGRKVVKDK